MSQQPAGWYDDPSDPDLLRYWDGVIWSSHTVPKRSPTASQSIIGQAQSEDPAVPQAPAASTQRGGGPWQGAPGHPQAPGADWMHALATTADGVPLASWGRRFVAWLLDGIILIILIEFLTRALVPGYSKLLDDIAATFGATDAGAADIEAFDWTALQDLAAQASGTFALASLVSYLTVTVYAIAFWTWTGQTPGKMVMGISVRRVDRPGPLDLATAMRRRLLALVQVIPVIQGFYVFLWLIDGLWPLWDDKRQTLHDKVAATQVVRGKQPPHQR
ncbi:MAG: RDD family protein [Micrococcales bacterium]|nr:RDD family protein [Micrococcales bacterium]